MKEERKLKCKIADREAAIHVEVITYVKIHNRITVARCTEYIGVPAGAWPATGDVFDTLTEHYTVEMFVENAGTTMQLGTLESSLGSMFLSSRSQFR